MCAALLAAIFTSPLWLSALGHYLVRAESPVHADIIVVLAGDFSGYRILTAGDLVRRGFAPKALISGPSGAYGMYESDLAIPFAVKHGYPAAYFVAFPNDGRSTREEAIDLLAELKRLHVHRVEIVTSDFHTRRAGNTYRSLAAGSEFDIHVVAAPNEDFTPGGWWKSREGRKTFLLEWLKTIASWFGV